MAKKLVGSVAHFFDKINVAALKVTGDFKIGDKISIEAKDGQVLHQQVISSMQVEHKSVQSAKKGDDVAIKLGQKVHEGNLVYKITE